MFGSGYEICPEFDVVLNIRREVCKFVSSVSKSNKTIVNRDNIDTPNSQIDDSSISWIFTGASKKKKKKKEWRIS